MVGASVSVVDGVLAAVLVASFAGAAVLAIVEVSLLRVRVSQVRVGAAQGDARSIELLALLDEMPLVLNTVLFVVLVCQVAVASISGYLAHRWAGGVWVSIASIVISLLLFVYAESVPKTMAVKAPHDRALRSAKPLTMLVRLLRPLVGALVAFAGLHSRQAGDVVEVITERELRLLARQAAQAGSIGVADADLVDRSFIFGDRQASDVMVDRAKIVAVPVQAAADKALDVAIAAGHRRVPVFGQHLDEIVGVIRMRDLAAAHEVEGLEVANLMTAPLFAGLDERIAVLLERMRFTTTWLAIVTGPHNETVGLVTVEDIVAELMGEIEEDPVVLPATHDDP